jgi:hypothetical protein
MRQPEQRRKGSVGDPGMLLIAPSPDGLAPAVGSVTTSA